VKGIPGISLLGPPSSNVHESPLYAKWVDPAAAIPKEFVGYFASSTELPTTTPSPKIPFFGFTLLCQQGEKMWLQRGRTKKGKNFYPEEEEQCCRSFMHSSTDSRKRIGQKNAAFRTSVALH
jgi:hypothetical protein